MSVAFGSLRVQSFATYANHMAFFSTEKTKNAIRRPRRRTLSQNGSGLVLGIRLPYTQFRDMSCLGWRVLFRWCVKRRTSLENGKVDTANLVNKVRDGVMTKVTRSSCLMPWLKTCGNPRTRKEINIMFQILASNLNQSDAI